MEALLALGFHFELFVLVLCRTTGLFLAAPVLSSPVMPRTAKILACGSMAVCMLPTVVAGGAGAGALPGTWVGLGLTAGRELLVGLVLGFFALLAVTALQVGGELLSEQMGFAMSKVVDPTTGGESAVVAQLGSVLGLLLFLAVDGHHWLIGALGTSFERVPVGAGTLRGPTLARLVDGFARMFESGVTLAAPVLCVTVLLTFAVGLVARLVPQINALMLAFPLKIGLGLLMLGIALPFITRAAAGQYASMSRELVPLLKGM